MKGGSSDDEIEEIAKRAAPLAAEQAIALIHQEIGKNVLRALYWAVGIIVTALLAWLGAKGLIK